MLDPSFDELPILAELRDDLDAAFRAHEAAGGGGDALAKGDTEAPARARARLGHVNHHPRSLRVRIGLALVGLAGLVAAAAIALFIVGLGVGTQRAFAGWTAEPTVPASGQTAAAEAACRPGHNGLPAAMEGTSGWQTVLTDTRGPYTVVLATSTHDEARCIVGPWPSSQVIGGGSVTRGQRSWPTVPAGQIEFASPAIGFASASGKGIPGRAPQVTGTLPPHTEAAGRIGAGVTGITFALSDGMHVTASVGDGWFLAWWPGSAEGVTAEVTTESGVTTQQVPTLASLGIDARRVRRPR